MLPTLLLVLACANKPDPVPTETPAPTPVEAPAPAPEPEPEPEPTEEPAPAETGDKLAAGEACLTADECASGVCEGEGCGDDNPGTCAPEMRGCTKDLRPYCGCDGENFQSSGSCPMQRFAHKGFCEEPPKE